jgi:hypothetical protein
LIAVSLSIFAHAQSVVGIMEAIVRDPALLFVSGLLGVAAGLAIVLSHNVWSGGILPIMVTLFGWASLIKGTLLLLLSPQQESQVFLVGLHFEQHPILYAAFIFLLGGYLSYAGFSSTSRFRRAMASSSQAD